MHLFNGVCMAALRWCIGMIALLMLRDRAQSSDFLGSYCSQAVHTPRWSEVRPAYTLESWMSRMADASTIFLTCMHVSPW